MTGPPKIPQADWTKHKDYLHDLYITKDNTLLQTIQQAESEHGFRPRCVNIRPLTILITLMVMPVRHSIYDSSRNGNSKRICVVISGRGLPRWYAIGNLTAKTAKSSSKTGQCLTVDYGRRCPGTGPTNMTIVPVRKFGLRRCIKSLIWLADLTLEDMDGVIVGTPQGQAVQVTNYLQIPGFQTPTEPYCKLRIFRAWYSSALIVLS